MKTTINYTYKIYFLNNILVNKDITLQEFLKLYKANQKALYHTYKCNYRFTLDCTKDRINRNEWNFSFSNGMMLGINQIVIDSKE